MPKKSSLPIKDFSKVDSTLSIINLNEIQFKSYDWFKKEGLQNLLKEVSPIRDHTGKELELFFDDYTFGEPKYDEATSRYKDATYEAPLHITVRLENKKTGVSQKQEIYFGDFPVMTDRGTFIINGVERVVVSQLVRSAGVYFTAVPWRGRNLFGAKVIPNRGSWLEFETDVDGVIGVKIDRRRKVPVTDILRIFGASEELIKTAFNDIDTGSIKYIDSTLKKDAAKNVAESYLEIYKRLRPGDPATPETAKNLIDAMFQRADRYDISPVGRFKINQRLGIKEKKDESLLDLDDLVKIVREIITLNNKPDAPKDDIDHLGNRRVKAVGELLQGRLRIGIARLRRIVQDRMSTSDRDTLMPAQLINFRPITAVVKEFFSSSQLSQFMDQLNPLAELEHKRRLSALGPGGLTRERASFEVRDVHRSHYGRICPIQTPEGANIGLINYLASFARVNDFGFLETPYAKVKNGKVTNEVIWMDALEEEKYRIVHAAIPRDKNGRIEGELVEARVFGSPGTCSVDEVDLIEVAPHQFVSVATSLIPFLQHDDANRALMGSNMQRQAVGSIRPTAPLVGTGQEEKVAADSGYLLHAEDDGEVVEVDSNHIKVKYQKGTKTYSLEKFKRSNQFTSISQSPMVDKGQKVKKGTPLASGPSIDNGILALGQNLLVAFTSWEGANFEDAIILSERVVRDDFFTSIHLEDYQSDVRDTKLGPEMTTPDIPNISEEKLKNLDEEGIVRIGAEVSAGDILVGKISPRGEAELTAEERLLRAIFGEKARDVKDSSLFLPHGKRGRIVGVKVQSRDQGDKLEAGIIKRIQVEVASLRKVQVGDKLAGRHGNKGVISQVRPVEDMPYLADGTPVDIILNPLGVVSRMNLGQILETHLGWAADKLGYRAVCPPFNPITEEEIQGELKKAGLPEDGKIELFDGRTGEAFRDRVTVGQIYMLKLNHLVEDKVHMRSIGPYSLITQQPLGGKAQFGGQRFGEMEVWALEGYGARHTLQEMLTIKSDDVLGRSAAYESIIRGEKIREPNIPASFHVLVNELKALGLNVESLSATQDATSVNPQDFNALRIGVASPDQIMQWSHGEVTKPETINYRTQRPEKDGLFSERIFGPTKDYECYCGKYRRIRYKGVVCDKCGVEVTRSIVRRERLGHIALAAPVSHIWFFKSAPSPLSLLLDVPSSKLERVLYYVDYIVTHVDEDNKKMVLEDLARELKSKLKTVEDKDKKSKAELSSGADELRSILEDLHVGQVLKEDEYFKLSRRFGNVFKAGNGAEAIRDIFSRMDLKKEVQRIEKELSHAKDPMAEIKMVKRIKMLRSMIKNGSRPEHLILTVLPVLPPDLRPMVALDGGRYATSDLNDLYRRVLNRNNRLKKLLEIKAPEIIIRNEKRMLQEAVDALIDNSARFGTQQLSSQRRPLRSLADMLKGKQGRFRQNLLGKRVDYSGRSVIVVGPQLPIDTCGLPKRMALELFRPFVIGEMIKRGIVHNIKTANRVIEQGSDEVWAILEEVIGDRRVLLNRAPTLHRLSVQAFKPVLVEGLAIRIPPLVCVAFNADFDGDQMAVHLPLGDDAQREAREVMNAGRNLLKPATGDLITGLINDAVLGIYYLTRLNPDVPTRNKSFVDFNEAHMAFTNGDLHLHEIIKIDGMETTIGRLIFNKALKGRLPYVNEALDKKKIAQLMETVLEQHGIDIARETLDTIKLLGFEAATTSGITWAMADLKIPEGKRVILENAEKEVQMIREQYNEGLLTEFERKSRVIDTWEKAKADMFKLVTNTLHENNSIYQIINSKSRGSWLQPSQMMGMRGLVINAQGEKVELPIKSSLKEGMSVIEYFISTHGARKGTTDTALKTAQAGYLTRRLVDVAQDLIIREEDCRTSDGIAVYRDETKVLKELGQTFANRLFSRTVIEDVKAGKKVLVKAGEMIDKRTAALIEKEEGINEVQIRSPLTCKTLYGICVKCYGFDLGSNQPVKLGTAVGVVAAQSIGEPGTQLTMRTFHTGGVAGLDITHGLPRVEELFEKRPPKGKAIISTIDGEVVRIEERGSLRAVMVREKEEKDKEKETKAKAKTTKKKSVENIVEFMIPKHVMILVKTGDKIVAGDQISEGNLDLQELLQFRGAGEVPRHIINEVQAIYMGEGSPINNKHIEIIVRQMFSRIRIKDSGDSDFVVGEVVEKSKFLEVNRQLRKEGKTPAKARQLLMGITRVALSTESFLSAASFQDTARVLVQGAIEGRVDTLRGLKENVIIGRLIPTGAAVEDGGSSEVEEEVKMETGQEE